MVLPVANSSASLVALPPPSLVARVGRRVLEAPRMVVGLPDTAKRMSLKLQAGVAEFLLITRLRARNQKPQPAQSADVLERGAHVVNVTCQSWFATTSAQRPMSTSHHTRL